MKTVFLTITILFFTLCGIGQPTEFFRTYDYGSISYPILSSIVELNNRLYVNGRILNTPNSKILILKTDKFGNTIDTALYGPNTGGFSIENFVILSNNNLLLLSQHIDTLGIFRQYMLYIDTNLIKFNDSLYLIVNSQFYGDCKLNNSYYFVGPTIFDDNGDSLPQSDCNIMLWKTDTNFITTSTKSIGTINPDAAWTIKSGFDNNILIGGLTLYNGNIQIWYLLNNDTTGQVLGQYFYGDLTHWNYDGIKSISLSSDSCYFISGYYYDSPNNSAIGLIKIDRQFNTIWTKYVGRTILSTSVSKLLATSDGNQAILAQRAPNGFTDIIYSQVTKLNNNGDILWSRDYLQGDTTQYIRYRAWDIIETSDKGFAFCGSAIDTTNVGPNQEAWLVKTDSLGCDGLRSCNDTALVLEILQYPDTFCQNDTNSIQVSIKGPCAPYSININGTVALDFIYYPYTLPIWIDTTILFFPLDTGWQSLIITLNDPWKHGVNDTIQVYVEDCSVNYASQDFYKRKVEIFPNPATTELHVKVRGVIENSYTITMYDTQGKTVDVITTKEQETVIDISKYPQGIYWVRVLGNNIVRSEKIIKLMTN